MTTALFVGRFQPFHLGHLGIIKEILKKHSNLIIVIGSTQLKDTIINPFSIDEREKMITLALNQENITKCQIVKVRDIYDHSKWVEHVEKHTEKFDVVYTGSKITKDLFELANYKVEDIKERIKGLSASEIRLRMSKDMEWDDLVPEVVAKYLKTILAEERVKALSQEEVMIKE